MFKPRRLLTQRPARNPAGDYSVSVDRSGMSIRPVLPQHHVSLHNFKTLHNLH
jgi:hypothetical protein